MLYLIINKTNKQSTFVAPLVGSIARLSRVSNSGLYKWVILLDRSSEICLHSRYLLPIPLISLKE